MKQIEQCEILSHERLQADIFKLVVSTEQMAEAVQAGQFVMIYLDNGANLLPRPISIASAEQKKMTLIYHTVGVGTVALSQKQVGDSLRILGPLGNGFDLQLAGERPWVIGGGIGTPPLYELTKRLVVQGITPQVLTGFRDAEQVILTEAFKALGADVAVTTDDGSVGIKGHVVAYLNQHFAKGDQPLPSALYACGPTPMLTGLSHWAEERRIPIYLSMEERMACGIGVCFGCVNKDKHGVNQKVCVDGPVFSGEAHTWEI